MQSEYKYLTFFVSTLLCIGIIFSFLFYKYTYLSLFHFAEVCSQSLTSFFTSWYHVTGFTILISILCLTGYLFLKFIFSTVKTEKKKKQFIASQLLRVPRYIKAILARHKIDQHSIVLVSKKASLAFTLGFFSQKIVLTTGLCKSLNEKELEAVILHEHYHLTNNHGLVLLIGKLISSTFFFLPFLKDAYMNMKTLFEYRADDYAHSMQNTKIYLISSINKISNHSHSFEFSPGFAVCTVEERLARLYGLKRSQSLFSFKKCLLTVPIVSLFTFLFALPIGAHINEPTILESNTTRCENNMSANAIQKMSIQIPFSPIK